MSSIYGRLLRIIVGAALIIIGIFVFHSVAWTVLFIVVGAVPFLAGVMDVCIFAPLFGGPFSGKKARAASKEK